ncbi:MAG: dihydrofolate reductase family protein [Micrococcales bacterium]|nr:dihydrofolate reductase family protein [Micrococcales bacterium]
MRLLLPAASGRPAGELTRDDLVEVYAPPSGSWLRCNMVTTLDGAANGPDGRSGSINTDADHVVFDLLRALSHVVVVGAGTVRAEGYPPLDVPQEWTGVRSARGLPDRLPLVVVSHSGNLPATVRDASAGSVLFATRSGAPGLADARAALGADRVIACGHDEVDLATLVTDLHARGWEQILTEGGPQLTGSFLGAGLMDELCFTIAPRIAGGDHLRPVGPAAGPGLLELRTLVEQDGTLMGRWFTTRT